MVRIRSQGGSESVTVDVDHRLEASDYPDWDGKGCGLWRSWCRAAVGPRECLALPAKIISDYQERPVLMARVGDWSMFDLVDRRVTRWAEIAAAPARRDDCPGAAVRT